MQPLLLLRFVKTRAKHDRCDYLRADGSTLSAIAPRQAVLPHDAFHYVVEQELGLERAFLGLLAAGAALDKAEDAGSPRGDGYRSEQALYAESLVECLQAAAWSGEPDPGALRAMLAVTCRSRGLVRWRDPDDGQIAQWHRELADLAARWAALAVGETLELPFQPRRNSVA